MANQISFWWMRAGRENVGEKTRILQNIFSLFFTGGYVGSSLVVTQGENLADRESNQNKTWLIWKLIKTTLFDSID